MKWRSVVACVSLLAFLMCQIGAESPETKEKNAKKKSVKLPPCAACTVLVGSFEAGMKRTSRFVFEALPVNIRFGCLEVGLHILISTLLIIVSTLN